MRRDEEKVVVVVQERSVDKGQRILEAAVEIFSTKPFHQVKVEDIAAAACVGKGTVYEYYKGKDDLFAAVFEEGGRIYMREMEASLDREGPVGEKLTNLIRTHLDFISKHRQRALLLLAEQRIIAPREVHQAILERRSRLLSLVRQTIRQGMEEGIFRPLDEEMAALFVIGGIISLWPLALAEEKNLLKDREEEVVEYILKGLQA